MSRDLRKYRLSLKSPNGSAVFQGGSANRRCLDISFDVSFNIASECRTGTISITGLTSERIASYIGLSVFTKGEAAQKMMRAELSVGYEGGDFFSVIDGYVVSGSQSAPPNKTLTMIVEESWRLGGQMFTWGTEPDEPLAVRDVFTELLGLWELDFSEGTCMCEDKSWLDEEVEIPKEERTLGSALSLLRGLSRRYIYVCADTAYVYDVGGETASGTECGTIGDEDLLGITGIDFYGCKVKTFLREMKGAILPTFTLNSSYNPHANGRYMAHNIRHVGHYYGNEWWTEMKCRRLR